jgi:hypothetical protein
LTTFIAIPLELNAHDKRVFEYYQTMLYLNKKPFFYSDNYKFITKLVSLNTKCGYKHKSFKLLTGALSYVYNYFEVFNKTLNSEYPNYTTFFEFSRDFPEEFYKPDFLVKYVYLYLELVFLIKRVKPKKKLKKKKIQQKLLVSYLSAHTRSKITIRLIASYLNSFTNFDKTVRIGSAMLYLILAGKHSFLYQKN